MQKIEASNKNTRTLELRGNATYCNQLAMQNHKLMPSLHGHRSVMPLERNHSGNPDTVIEKIPNYGIG